MQSHRGKIGTFLQFFADYILQYADVLSRILAIDIKTLGIIHECLFAELPYYRHSLAAHLFRKPALPAAESLRKSGFVLYLKQISTAHSGKKCAF